MMERKRRERDVNGLFSQRCKQFHSSVIATTKTIRRSSVTNFTTRGFLGVFLFVFVSATLPMVACEDPDETSLEGETSMRITNGKETTGYKSVGRMSNWCTGTLIEERTVLTAGHCAKKSTGWFEVGGRKYNWSKNYVHPDYKKVDLGLIILDEPVRSVTPSPLSRSPVSVGQKITMVGYGSTDNNGGNYNMTKKYVGTNTIDGLNWRWYWYTGPSYNCGGDSGGASFIGNTLVGVIFSGDGRNCSKTTGWDMRVDAFIDWIESKAAGKLPGGS